MTNRKSPRQPPSNGVADDPVNPTRRRLLGGLALVGTALAALNGAPRAWAGEAAAEPSAGTATSGAAPIPDARDALRRGLNLMPWPTEVTFLGESPITLPARIGIHWPSDLSPRAMRALKRFTERLESRSQTRFEPTRGRQPSAFVAIDVARPGQLTIGEDESYTLRLDERGIRLRAATDLGLIRGLATLDQLLTENAGRLSGHPLSIHDTPRFRWRGLMIDSARHFQPLPVLYRNLRGMEAVKLNVLHLHLSDNQGFRVESRALPKLTATGSNGEFYTQKEIRELIAYAADRGILIVPEFDMPSHGVSWFVGYPELASAPGPYHPYTHFGGQMASFDPTNPDVYKVLDGFFAEMSELFSGNYLHIGGDENSGQQWTFNPSIQVFMRELNAPPIESNTELQALFTNRVSRIVARHGKTPIGWDEVLQPGVQKDIIIQSWRGNTALVEAATAGYKALLSHGYYLDLYNFTSDYYLNDPIPPGTEISAGVASNILGGEAAMWSELATPEVIDSRIWPNMAAIAERLWSPPHVRDVEWMYARLGSVDQQLASLGLTQLSGPAAILEGLAGGEGVATLAQFAALVSPIRDYQRSRRQYTTTTPFDSLVDAAVTPVWGAVRFRQAVTAVRRNPGKVDVSHVRAILESWGKLAQELDPLARGSAKLADAVPLATALGALAEIGLDACGYLESGRPAPVEWARSLTNDLIAADQVHADLRLRVVESVRDLVSLAIMSGKGKMSA